MTSDSIAGKRHQVRSPSRTPTRYSFIDQPRAVATARNQSVSFEVMRNETTGFSSVGVLGMSCIVRDYVLQVNHMSTTARGCRRELERSRQRSIDMYLPP